VQHKITMIKIARMSAPVTGVKQRRKRRWLIVDDNVFE